MIICAQSKCQQTSERNVEINVHREVDAILYYMRKY